MSSIIIPAVPGFYYSDTPGEWLDILAWEFDADSWPTPLTVWGPPAVGAEGQFVSHSIRSPNGEEVVR